MFGGGAIGAEAVLGRGSIPACAGEPPAYQGASSAPRVYPRVCGGTGNNRLPVAQGQGLSPRGRGSLAGLADVGCA